MYAAVIQTNPEEKSLQIQDLIESNMAPSHQAVLNILLRHLLKVTGFKEFNRMEVLNLSIVFGPSLMWPPIDNKLSSFVAANHMSQQNIIVQELLFELQIQLVNDMAPSDFEEFEK